jgi:putative two-component system response regulator
VLLDLHMPVLDGFAVLERLQELVAPDDYLPRLVITADATTETRRRALALGAHDFLTKPIDVLETTLRVANLVRTRALHVGVRQHNARLEHAVRERTAELAQAQHEVAVRLGRVAEFRDDDTAEHTSRVGQTAAATRRPWALRRTWWSWSPPAAPLHDIGKVAIPDAILPSRPADEEEFEVIRTHAAVGAHILGGGTRDWSGSRRRWPSPTTSGGTAAATRRGSRRRDPAGGRLVAVADVFDALTHPAARTSRQAGGAGRRDDARRAGPHFDPQLLDLFLAELDGRTAPAD